MAPLVHELRRPLENLRDPLPVPTLAPGAPGAPPRRVEIRPPGSKSLTNRALLLAALADGRSELRGALLDADDTQHMMVALRALGASIAVGAGAVSIEGVGGRWRPAAGELRLDLGNAGTATRFLAAAALLSPAPVVIDGNDRMRQRPLGELIGALRALGARVGELGAPGCPPVRIDATGGVRAGATIELGPTSSSQFISALLLVAPWLPGGLTLRLTGPITSRSYVEMTANLLDRLGVNVQLAEDLHVIRIDESPPAPLDMPIEPDASGATCLWAAAALTPGLEVCVPGLGPDSIQGDARFPEMLARMGARLGADGAISGAGELLPVITDMRLMPDAAMALVATCALLTRRSVIRGLQTLRVKETDRLEALRAELAKVGVVIELDLNGEPGTIAINPPAGGIDVRPTAAEVVFDTYNDHRMAMAMALIGLRRPNVLIRDPGCVRKTYPGYWLDLARLYE
jgi:3-phosphoshikimate 1-carboxyvinyltransferase